MDEIYDYSKFATITLCRVKIKFSKEISYWDDKGYYENPKFWEYWDKYNNRRNSDKYGNDVWRVAYSSDKQRIAAEKREVPNGIRYLICNDTCVMLSANGMNAMIINRPDRYRTTIRAFLSALYNAIKECASFCGGTAEFTYTDEQVLPYTSKPFATLEL